MEPLSVAGVRDADFVCSCSGGDDYASVKTHIMQALEKRNRLMPEWLRRLKEGKDS